LLVAYDGSQFYRAFDCASDALKRNELDLGALANSDARLKRTFRQDALDKAGRRSPDRHEREQSGNGALTTRHNPARSTGAASTEFD
jgi:hypothetical protein